ncbi:MAG: hypothetical protein QHJ73_19485 [Armatimonadota bacterium]|nr:hypothetical protein [Armatimonadota bacterium]
MALTGAPGCGGGAKRNTPEACLQAFDAAMRKGDVDTAAGLFALAKIAELNATDWATYPASQRQLILQKMREDQAQKLSAWRNAYLQGGYKLGPIRPGGEWATAVLEGARDRVTVRLYRTNNQWAIYQVGSLPLPLPG